MLGIPDHKRLVGTLCTVATMLFHALNKIGRLQVSKSVS